jgi:hypothetical protein
MEKRSIRRTLFRHPLAALGGALIIAGGSVFVLLVLADITFGTKNPFMSLVTFIILPFIITVGAVIFLIAIILQIRAARKRGEKVTFRFAIDPTDKVYMKNLWRFLGILAVVVVLMVYSGSKAYDATDSAAFCGQTCHVVMEPQNVTYHNSPHARVPCVDCHIGPGASFFVRSKYNGIKQLFRTVLNDFPRPIPTPIHSLRPAQQTCEACHWPQQFYGNKLISRTYYRTDEENSPWSIDLIMKIGGGHYRTLREKGIHWHMLIENKVEYIATDKKRQVIPWVRSINPQGDTAIFTVTGADHPDPEDPETEVRVFDCMDCHNRPSHNFLAPATGLNRALASRDISPDLPYIRKEGLDLLNAPYKTREAAHKAISYGVMKYYQDNYPDVSENKVGEIRQATESLIRLYDQGFFPEMKTDYRVRDNNLSHFVNDGCFRCHDGSKTDGNGKTIPHDCQTCHLIAAQGPSENIADVESNIDGMEFKHPEDIDEAWKEMNCTDCHTPESGY